MPRPRRTSLAVVLAAALTLAAQSAAQAAAPIVTTPVVVPMVFPVVGPVSYADTFLACRSGCERQHLGQDLMGRKLQPLVAVFDGRVSTLKRETETGLAGNYVTIQGDTGWSANYVHLNNDRPGTDDGRGTAAYAFAPGLEVGDRVFAGQLLGWLGDSGNAENTAPHLHFELRQGGAWSGTVYNAMPSLDRAVRLAAPRTSGPHPVGTFIRTAAATAPIWRITADGKRRVAPSVLAALGFRPDQVVVVSAAEERWYRRLSALPLPDGRVYRAPDGGLWVVVRGTRIAVSDARALASLAVPADRVRPADAAALAATPVATTPLPGVVREGAVLRAKGGTQVWLVRDGKRVLVPTWYTLARWGRQQADVAWVSQQAIDALPAAGTLTLPDGLQLMDSIDRRWIVTDGTRRRLTVPVAEAFGWMPVRYTRPPGGDAARLPLGVPLP